MKAGVGRFTRVGVGDVDGAAGGGAEEDADDALTGVAGDAVVVVDDAEQHQGVHHYTFAPTAAPPSPRPSRRNPSGDQGSAARGLAPPWSRVA
jgi:hypothetical protein